ncbi:hypothetical protein VTK56DRAFT_6339 [Thermocarpiscus australiensis]
MKLLPFNPIRAMVRAVVRGVNTAVRAVLLAAFFILAMPLAIFAGFTTVLAFAVLWLRVVRVYVGMALAIVPSWLGRKTGTSPEIADLRPVDRSRIAHDSLRSPSPAGSAGSSGSDTPSPRSVPQAPINWGSSYWTFGYWGSGYISPRRRRSSCRNAGLLPSRRSSSQSLDSIRENEVATELPPPQLVDVCITPSIGMDRDFEGIGGWRFDDREDDDVWDNINSRLEMPNERSLPYLRHNLPPQSLITAGSSRGGGREPPVSPRSSQVPTNQDEPAPDSPD